MDLLLVDLVFGPLLELANIELGVDFPAVPKCVLSCSLMGLRSWITLNQDFVDIGSRPGKLRTDITAVCGCLFKRVYM